MTLCSLVMTPPTPKRTMSLAIEPVPRMAHRTGRGEASSDDMAVYCCRSLSVPLGLCESSLLPAGGLGRFRTLQLINFAETFSKLDQSTPRGDEEEGQPLLPPAQQTTVIIDGINIIKDGRADFHSIPQMDNGQFQNGYDVCPLESSTLQEGEDR